jgi:hypothetical protein
LDHAGIDHESKMVIEGHFSDARSKHYSSREWDTLRPVYQKAFPEIDLEGSNPELETKLADWQVEKTALENKIKEMTAKEGERERFEKQLLEHIERVEKRVSELEQSRKKT